MFDLILLQMFIIVANWLRCFTFQHIAAGHVFWADKPKRWLKLAQIQVGVACKTYPRWFKAVIAAEEASSM